MNPDPMHVLLLDNYDSFTYNLFDYVQRAGAHCTVLRNDAFDPHALSADAFDALLLSPGPQRPSDAGCLMAVIGRFWQSKPILGVCLGHQALGEWFGAPLVRAPQPRHGKTSVLEHNGSALFDQLPPAFRVMRYHSLVLEHLDGTPLRPTAYSTDDHALMAFEHPALPLWGVQFHPESVLTEHGEALLANWLKACSAALQDA
jgi:anthranilate synthase/aminodeoxychorismate synthase-like glutamine amidotransferase